METMPLWLPLVFFVIALLYATVGFGGGSSYLAVLAFIGLPYHSIPQVALLCNLAVSGGGVWHFYRGGHLDLRKILPFIVLSIPLAFFGGQLPIGRQLFMILLGGSLFAAGARTFLPQRKFGPGGLSPKRAWQVGLPIGAALGFLAGLVGIGGGIFLAPVLILAGWANAKQAAAAAAIFIIVNSAAGLVGQLSKGVYLDTMVIPLVLAVVLGGQIGSRLGAYRLRVVGVRQLLGLLILFVSIRLVWSAI